jgi:hypothetical protein
VVNISKQEVAMKVAKLGIVVLLSVLVFSAPSYATTLYEGSLTWVSPNGTTIFATGAWADDTTSLSWKISTTSDPEWLLYSYTWTTTAKELSHIILEVSDLADSDDFKDFDPALVELSYPKSYSSTGSSGSNPNMPASGIWGIKFDTGYDTTNYSFSFLSNRDAMWGDFYAKDGNDGPVYAYNAGFGKEWDGNSGWVMVPDTKYYTPPPQVPIPGAVWLLGSGLLGLLGLRRKFLG